MDLKARLNKSENGYFLHLFVEGQPGYFSIHLDMENFEGEKDTLLIGAAFRANPIWAAELTDDDAAIASMKKFFEEILTGEPK